MENENKTKEVKKKKLKLKLDIKKALKKPLFYISSFLVIFSILLIFTVIKIKVLGLKFLIPIILAIIIIDGLLLYFLYKKKTKKTKIALSTISTILAIIYLVISIVLLQVYASMNNMFKNNSFIDYSVCALKKSSYKKIDDVDKKIIGYYVDDKYNEAAKKQLNKKIEVEFIGYSSINELKNALLIKEIDAMLIMDSYLDLDNSNNKEETEEIEINEEKQTLSDKEQQILDKIENFDSDSKIIYRLKVKVDNSKKSKKINLEKGSFAIYVSGQDSYDSSVSEASRSDVNLLMVVNLKSKQILLLSIPRDYYINISSKKAYDKLTHISLYGPEETMNSIGDLLDISVDYYVKFNFTTFMKAVEYLLPLDVYSDYSFTTSIYDQTIGDTYSFSKGYNHITNGKMALQFVRARKNFSEGDRQRGINQSRFLRAVINKVSTPSVLLKYNKILKSLEGTFLTNISNESLQEIAKYILNNNGSFNINSISLNGSDATRPTYSGGSQALYVMIPNNTTIENAKIQIKTIFEGGTPEIEQDASELADVKDTHTVTKGTGSSYSYSKGSTSKKTPVKNTPTVIQPSTPENEENNDDNDNNENDLGNEPSDDDKEQNSPPEVPVNPTNPPATSTPDPSTPSEDNSEINS